MLTLACFLALASGTERTADQAVYLQADAFSLILLNAGAVSLNYDWRFDEWASLHVGGGYSSWGELMSGSGAKAVAAEIETKLVAGGDYNAFEAGIGVGVAHVYDRIPGDHCDDEDPDGCDRTPQNFVHPVFSLGWRYQQPHGGGFMRAGVGWHYGFGAGFSFGIGKTF